MAKRDKQRTGIERTRKMTKWPLTTLALIEFIGTAANGQGTVRLAVGGDSRLWIEGSSNASSWTCTATTVDAAIDVDVGFREARIFRSICGAFK